MPKIEYKYTYLFCPNCQYKFGHRRIGPEKIECGSCGAVLDTGLPVWDQLSTESQFKLFLAEMILPSWIGVTGCQGTIMGVLTQFTLWAFVSAPFWALSLYLMESSVNSAPIISFLGMLLLLVSPFIYPAILVRRMRRLVRESQEYSSTQEPPIWGEKQEKLETPEERISTARYFHGGYTLLLRMVALLLVPVWIIPFYKTVHALIYSGLQTNDYLVIGALWLVVLGVGWLVQRELARCLGRIVMPGCLVIPLMPFFLLILAISPHKIHATIRELKQMSRELASSRAKYIDMIDYGKKRAELIALLEETRDPRSVKPLMNVLRDREARYRIIAATTLGEIGDARAVESLIKALKDKDAKVRVAAAVSLGKIKDLRAKVGLEELIEDQDESVRDAAREALGELAIDSGGKL